MLLELDTGFFSHFVHADPDLNPWYEDIQGRKKLLITIGDSWTWGDSLGTTRHRYGISDPNRTKMVYGYHLQSAIGDCDWCNIAWPGTANQWIVDVALRFQHLQKLLSYEKILISVGLTDITRDVFQRGIMPEANGSFFNAAKIYERNYFTQLLQLSQTENIQLIVGRNFTNTFDENLKILPNHLSKRWIDISAQHWDSGITAPACIGLKFPDQLVNEDEKRYSIDIAIPNSQAVTDFLEQCPLHYKRATKHPHEQCHVFWAEYLYDFLGQINFG